MAWIIVVTFESRLWDSTLGLWSNLAEHHTVRVDLNQLTPDGPVSGTQTFKPYTAGSFGYLADGRQPV